MQWVKLKRRCFQSEIATADERPFLDLVLVFRIMRGIYDRASKAIFRRHVSKKRN
jgi:hypothetical protein